MKMVSVVDLQTLLKKQGWEEDKFGRLKLESPEGKIYRWKFQKISFRLEVQIKKEWSKKREWLRLRSGYLSQVEIIEEKISGKLFGTFWEEFGARLKFPEEIKSLFFENKKNGGK